MKGCTNFNTCKICLTITIIRPLKVCNPILTTTFFIINSQGSGDLYTMYSQALEEPSQRGKMIKKYEEKENDINLTSLLFLQNYMQGLKST